MRSLALKITLAFLLVSLAGIVLVAIFTGRATAAEFGHFMMAQDQDFLSAELADYYQVQSGWTGVERVLRGGPPGMGNGAMHGMVMGGGAALVDTQGNVVVAGGGYFPGERLAPSQLATGIAILVDGQRVGTLIPAGNTLRPLSQAGTEFLLRVNRALSLAAIGAAALAIILGAALARALTRPLTELKAATRALAAGQLGQQVNVRSRDELGELASAFNQMSADLARARDQRRQMTADIAHDLRTPLSVILGHAEALRDGILLPTPETLALVHEEAQRLNRLVDDLRTLSLAEAGELTLTRRPTPPGALLERAVAAQTPRALQQKISVQTQVDPGLPEVDVDPDRMAQVLGNLLDNALQHTPSGGSVVCRVTSDGARTSRHSSPATHHPSLHEAPQAERAGVTFAISDTGPGISPEDLPRLFDRFFRADKSRLRQEQGGSGLGLAIAKTIVEAHGGRIWAESQPGAGAQFFVELPVV